MDSSLWEEKPYVRVLFMTMLALKDADFVVRLDEYRLHKKANITQEETLEALKILSSPDRRRTLLKQEFDGRRIQKVEGGWLLLNGRKYRELMQKMKRRDYQAEWQAEYRELNKEAEKAAWEQLLPQMQSLTKEEVDKLFQVYKAEHRKRLKLLKHAAACAGAQDAISEGFRETEG